LLTAVSLRLFIRGVAVASGLETSNLVGLDDLAFDAAPARRLAAFHRLDLAGRPVGASQLETLRFGSRVVDLTIYTAVSFRLAGFYCLGLVDGPEAFYPGALTSGGLVDIAVRATPAFRLAVAIPILLVVRGIVAARIRASLGVTEICCLHSFQAIGASVRACKKSRFIMSSWRS
jgi:hypothetical protein